MTLGPAAEEVGNQRRSQALTMADTTGASSALDG